MCDSARETVPSRPSVDYPVEQEEESILFSLLISDVTRDGQRDLLLLAPFGIDSYRDCGLLAKRNSTLIPRVGGGKLSTNPQYYL